MRSAVCVSIVALGIGASCGPEPSTLTDAEPLLAGERPRIEALAKIDNGYEVDALPRIPPQLRPDDFGRIVAVESELLSEGGLPRIGLFAGTEDGHEVDALPRLLLELGPMAPPVWPHGDPTLEERPWTWPGYALAFELATSPDGTDPLIVWLELAAARLEMEERPAPSPEVVGYDALGRSLPIRAVSDVDGLWIEVRDQAATYPLWIEVIVSY